LDALNEVENLLASSVPKKEPKKNALVARSPRSTNLGLKPFNKELEDLKNKMFKDHHHALVRDFWGKEIAIEVRELELTKAKIELQKLKSKERQEHT